VPSVQPSSPPPSPTPTETAAALAEVPAILGIPLEDAARMLAQRGFVTGAVTRVDGTAAFDTVLGADPAPGEHRASGTPIAVQVASGNNVVPALFGRSAADATAVLGAAGFAVSVEYGGTGEPGFVASSSPESGTVAALGTVVTVRIPRTAPPTPAPSSPAPSPSPSLSPTPPPA
jgi:beta-lactam-binding protein with PASTA domain